MEPAAALLELQRIDVEILRLNKRLEELPEKRAILASRAKQRETAELRQKVDLLVRKLESELKSRQDEIDMIDAKLSEEQAKLIATSDHRQVQALSREMDGLKRRKDKLEMESLQFVERVDKAKVQAGTVDGHLAKMAAEENVLTERFKEVGGALTDEIGGLEAARKRIAKSVPAKLLADYDHARESRGGIGVGALKDGACTACRMQLPAERVRDLEIGADVGVCPQCRRLIVVRGVVAE